MDRSAYMQAMIHSVTNENSLEELLLLTLNFID